VEVCFCNVDGAVKGIDKGRVVGTKRQFRDNVRKVKDWAEKLARLVFRTFVSVRGERNESCLPE
jgi:hypothetical protein